MKVSLIAREERERMARAVSAEGVEKAWRLGGMPDDLAWGFGALAALDEVYEDGRGEAAEKAANQWCLAEVGAAAVYVYGDISLAVDWAGIRVECPLFAEVTDWNGGGKEGRAWRVMPWEAVFHYTVFGSDMEDPKPGTKENSGAAAREYAKQLRAMADRFEKIADVLEG